MKTYKTYQEAKIENPNSEIVTTAPSWEFDKRLIGAFEPLLEGDFEDAHWLNDDTGWVICKPADYLPSLEWFFDEGYALISGDLISDRDGNVIEIGKVNVAHRVLDEGYVLRADALTETKVITEAPEKKSPASIPYSLKNTKVHTTDNEVVRKYVELCGFSYSDDLIINYPEVGVGFNLEEIFKLYKNSFYAILLTEVTPEQVNKMHAEKFGKVESPEEKEAFDAIKEIDLDHPITKTKIGENESVGYRLKGSELIASSEWKNGDECMIRGEKLIYIGESVEADIHCVQELGTCLYRNAHISVIEKLESPEQKADRERFERGEEMYIQYCKNMGADKFCWDEKNNASKEAWCKLAEQYRKGQ